MENSMMEEHKYQVVICAVLFGCDDSFVGLDMGEGLMIERKSLVPKDSLDKIFEVDAMGLRRDYETARIGAESLDVACIYKAYEYLADNKSAHDYYEQISSELFICLDNQVRAIRLLTEGPVRYLKLAVKLCSETYMFGETSMSCSYSGIMPVGEAYGVQTISKAHCQNVETLRTEMNKIAFPIEIEYLQQCHVLFDRSYLVTLPEAEILLITALEVLFLKSEEGKREKLSKRCAVFIYETEKDRLKYYRKLRDEYKNRSDYVHDGNARKISAEGILFLRGCVRSSLLRLLSTPQEKRVLISNLKIEIEKIDYWPDRNSTSTPDRNVTTNRPS